MDIFSYVMYDVVSQFCRILLLPKLDSLSHVTSLIFLGHKKVSDCIFQIHLLLLSHFSCNSSKCGCG